MLVGDIPHTKDGEKWTRVHEIRIERSGVTPSAGVEKSYWSIEKLRESASKRCINSSIAVLGY